MPLTFNSFVALNFGAAVAGIVFIYIALFTPLTSIYPNPLKFRVRAYYVKLIEMGSGVLFRRVFDIKLSGDLIDPKESAIILVNHQCLLDYLLLYHLARNVELFFLVRGHCVRFFNLGIILKTYRDRANWIISQRHLDAVFAEYNKTPGPKWVVMFPEVSMFSPQLVRDHEIYCKLAGASPLRNLLYPRYPGVLQGIEYLRGDMTSIYDFTVQYSTASTFQAPSLLAIASDNLWTAHISVEQTRITKVPRTAKKLEKFIEKTWYEKDRKISKKKL